MRPTALRRRVVAVALLTGVITGSTAGCAGTIDPGDREAHRAARAAVAETARDLDRARTDLIDDYARWAVADIQGTNVELIGYEAYEGAAHADPVGALRFRSTVQSSEYGDPHVACFESEFDFWGVATEEFDDWSDDEAVARDIPCPPDAAPVPPPVDTHTVYVVPEGAEELVVDVLAEAPAAASAPEIVAELVERMPQPTGEREAPFTPQAVVDGDRIGVAMGDAGACLLVTRTADGVEVLHVPSVLLQPGELGCSPDTALRPVEQLRSPH